MHIVANCDCGKSYGCGLECELMLLTLWKIFIFLVCYIVDSNNVVLKRWTSNKSQPKVDSIFHNWRAILITTPKGWLLEFQFRKSQGIVSLNKCLTTCPKERTTISIWCPYNSKGKTIRPWPQPKFRIYFTGSGFDNRYFPRVWNKGFQNARVENQIRW